MGMHMIPNAPLSVDPRCFTLHPEPGKVLDDVKDVDIKHLAALEMFRLDMTDSMTNSWHGESMDSDDRSANRSEATASRQFTTIPSTPATCLAPSKEMA